MENTIKIDMGSGTVISKTLPESMNSTEFIEQFEPIFKLCNNLERNKDSKLLKADNFFRENKQTRSYVKTGKYKKGRSPDINRHLSLDKKKELAKEMWETYNDLKGGGRNNKVQRMQIASKYGCKDWEAFGKKVNYFKLAYMGGLNE